MALNVLAPGVVGDAPDGDLRDEPSRAWLAAIVDSSNDAIISTSLDGVITSWNRGAEKIFLYTRQEAIGKPVGMLFPSDRKDEQPRHLARIARGEMISNFETVRMQKNGSRIHVSVSMAPIKDRGHGIVGASKIARDITSQKQVEKALRESEERFRSLVFTLTQIVWIADAQGEVVQPLPTWQAFTGQTAKEIMGKGWMDALHPDDVARTTKVWNAAVESRSTYVVDYRVRRHDGIYRLFGGRGVPLLNEDGSIREWIGTCTDITEQRQFQRGQEQIMRLLSSAVEQARDSIMITDADLDAPGPRILFVNPAFTKLTGYTAQEVLGMSPRILQGPRSHRDVLDRLRRLLASGEPFQGETINYRKDGTEFMLEWRVAPIRSIGGVITHFVAIQHDVTERNKAVESLRSSEERFRQLAENIDEVFWLNDPLTHQILYVSPAYESIWGRSCSSLYGNSGAWLDVVHPDDRDRVFHAVVTKQPAGDYDEEYRIVRPDGTVRWIRDRAFPVRNMQGEVYRIAGVAEDISEQRFADEALKMQGRVLESMSEGVAVCDDQGQILFSNTACSQMFDYEPGEIIGRHMTVLNNMTQEESLQFDRHLVAHLEAHGFWKGELRSRKKNGSSFVTHMRISVLEIANTRSFVAVFEDITEKKNMEAQFLRSQRMESVGRLSSGIAHDLNNILAPILMSVFMLRRPLSPEEFEKMLNMIEASTQRGADLIKQLLTFGRGRGGQRTVVQTRALMQDMEKIIRSTFPKNIIYSTNTPADCWPVIGDATQLHQILLNLCVNARDAMANGGSLSLTVANVRLDENYAAMNAEAAPGPYVVFRVTDTGEGIAPEIMDKIFDPFFSTKETGKGTGLGLSTVIGIVKSHEGFLNLRSQIGSGSTFEIYLPAVPDAVHSVDASPSAMPPRGNGEMILVVDDESGIREVVQSTLLRHGYRVVAAGDGTEAVALYTQHRGEIRLVMTDIMMPFMDGVTMCRTLKKMDPSIKIIASSGIGSARGKHDRTIELASLGVNIFLTKPYSAHEFLSVIHGLLHETPAAA